MKRVVQEKVNRIQNLLVKVVEVRNDFFGDLVTVSGLLTGKDIINALKSEKNPGQIILLPPNCVNTDNRFLDDLTPEDLERKFKRRVVVGSYDLVQTFVDIFESAELT